MTINIFKSRIRSPKDALLHLAFGVTIGYLIGFLFIFDGDHDISEHIQLMEHKRQSQRSDSFNLRCVIVLHKATHKPEKVISALSDGYTKLCHETIYFTNNQNVFDKFQKNHTIYFVDSNLNHFYWSYYQYVMEFSSKVPSQWTFIGDDQTYLIVPNLQNVLNTFDSEKPIVFGKVRDMSSMISWLFPFSSFKKISVRAGVVLSNTAIDKLSACKGFFFARASDYALYDCSEDFGVQIADPFDEDALRLFNDLPPKQIIAPDSKLFRSASEKNRKCSDHAVSFGQLSEKDMRVLQYGMSLKVFGRGGHETFELNETTIA